MCGGEHINIHVLDTLAAGFFCVNSRFGNHLTSVTSCYVSAGQRARQGCEMERRLKEPKHTWVYFSIILHVSLGRLCSSSSSTSRLNGEESLTVCGCSLRVFASWRDHADLCPCVRVTQPPTQLSEPCLYILLISPLKVRTHHHVRWSLFIPAHPLTSFSPSLLGDWLNVGPSSCLPEPPPPINAQTVLLLRMCLFTFVYVTCVNTCMHWNGCHHRSNICTPFSFACRWEETMWWDFPQIPPLSLFKAVLHIIWWCTGIPRWRLCKSVSQTPCAQGRARDREKQNQWQLSSTLYRDYLKFFAY